ncbi:hypothetical protein COL5a_006337 [Colletotrichum fioriniae]|nr:hypothetical protein COL5a_006337 [Colletotrichum fioriniae]
MFSFNAIIALMGIAVIVNGAPTDSTVTKRLDDIKNCYCGRDTGSALVSDPTSTKNACPDYGTVGTYKKDTIPQSFLNLLGNYT